MSVMLACGLLLPCVTAALAIRAGWRRDVALPPGLLAALGLGLGAALGACTFWIALLSGMTGRPAVIGLDVALCAAAALACWWRVPPGAGSEASPPRRAMIGAELALAGVVGVAAIAALVAFALNAELYPHGEWDAWAIWNVRARFLSRAGGDWRAAFSSELMHADYPPLLPAAVAHAWSWAGSDAPAAPLGLAAQFGLALVLLTGAALATLRDRSIALLGAACLLGTPILLQRAAWQYADTPLAFFLLATVALLAVADRARSAGSASAAVLGLAGVAAGCAALTKNEGVLFVLAIALARALMALRGGGLEVRGAAAFALGLAPVLLLLVHFKLALAPSSYLFANQTAGDYLARLGDPSRYGAVGAAFAAEAWRSLGPLVVALLLAALLFGATGDAVARRAAGWIGTAVAAIGLGYAAVYVVTPLDLTWQLSHSVDRLVLHLWPSAVFAVLLAVASPDEGAPSHAAWSAQSVRRRPTGA